MRAIRSENSPIEGTKTECCLRAKLLTRIFQRTQRPLLLEAAQDTFETFAARRIGHSDVFWGWNGHNLLGFKTARAAGQRILCERGSTHAAWAARRLSEVHTKLGWGRVDSSLGKRDQKAIQEYSFADKVIVPSKFVRDTFLEEGFPESSLFVNPYGIDERLWGSVDGENRECGPLVFVCTASMTPRKGIHILLRAWKKASLRNCELWLCGGLHFPLEEAGVSLDNSVKMLGYTSHKDLAKVYSRASVYVLPSFEEGMARSGLEAMAAGLPMIVTKETGLTDVMEEGKHGWVVPSGDENALADTLKMASADIDQIHRMGRDSRMNGLQQTKEAYGDRAAAFLKDFLNS